LEADTVVAIVTSRSHGLALCTSHTKSTVTSNNEHQFKYHHDVRKLVGRRICSKKTATTPFQVQYFLQTLNQHYMQRFAYMVHRSSTSSYLPASSWILIICKVGRLVSLPIIISKIIMKRLVSALET
jgi:hypothetical protein